MHKCFLFLITSLLSLSACKNDDKKIKPGDKPKAAPVPVVDAFVVKTTPLSDNISLTGSLLANEETEIHPEISGRLTYLNLAEGSAVGKGAVIARIYDGDLQAQLKKLNVQLATARTTTKRYEELVKIDGVSRQEYDMQMLNINTILADMNIVRSNLQRTVVRAPFSGTLGLRTISPGSYVTPASVLGTIRQNSQLKMDFTLPERYAPKLQNGTLVDFTVDNNPETYHAKIIATERSINEADRSLKVRTLVVKNDGKLLPGSFVKVNISFDPDPNAISVPGNAIIPQARGKAVAVFRNGKVNFDPVETGIRDSSMVQIVSGLKAGDTVIVSGLMSLKPNADVKIGKVQ